MPRVPRLLPPVLNHEATALVPDVAEMLLSAIAVDTINFDSSKGRCTEADIAVAEQVRRRLAALKGARPELARPAAPPPCSLTSPAFSPQLRPLLPSSSLDDIFNRVQGAKTDVAGLTPLELLRKVLRAGPMG